MNKDTGSRYMFASHLLYAEDFGVPQHRERFVVIGNRLGIDPENIFDEIFKNKRESFILKDALEGLPRLGIKSEKGKNNIENDNCGYIKCQFDYIKNNFYYFINGTKENKLFI